jgi:hypothetical protein
VFVGALLFRGWIYIISCLNNISAILSNKLKTSRSFHSKSNLIS